MFFDDQPFTVIQIIWISLIHDIFSSIALSNEIPSKYISTSKPFKRDKSFIDKHLLKIIIFQVTAQTISLSLILFLGPLMFGVPNSSSLYNLDKQFVWSEELGIHYTIFFHIATLSLVKSLIFFFPLI